MATDRGRIHTLVLAPHFDDAAFSCGGNIRRQTAGGRRVVVVTVCAAPPSAPLSPYAASLHRRWGAETGAKQAALAMVARRRAEDEDALGLLGAEGLYLDVPDCIYRTGPDGDWLYQSDAAIFGTVAPGDAATADHIASALATLPGLSARTRVLAPLAVGQHVDHQLVRAAAGRAFAQRGLPPRFYEDYPYAVDEGALAVALDGRDWPLGDEGAAATSGDDNALAATVDEDAWTRIGHGRGWRPRLVRLSEAHLAAKLAAAARYRSQISTFWPDEAGQRRALRDFALRRGAGRWPAERLWERAPSAPEPDAA